MGISGVARYFFMSAPAATAHADICNPGDDRRPPRPRPESSVRAVRPLAVSLPGGPGPRDHCRALGEQPALCRALGTPRRVRSSDDRLRVPKLTLHLVGMSR